MQWWGASEKSGAKSLLDRARFVLYVDLGRWRHLSLLAVRRRRLPVDADRGRLGLLLAPAVLEIVEPEGAGAGLARPALPPRQPAVADGQDLAAEHGDGVFDVGHGVEDAIGPYGGGC